jgi:hypothetical protein
MNKVKAIIREIMQAEPGEARSICSRALIEVEQMADRLERLLVSINDLTRAASINARRARIIARTQEVRRVLGLRDEPSAPLALDETDNDGAALLALLLLHGSCGLLTIPERIVGKAQRELMDGSKPFVYEAMTDELIISRVRRSRKKRKEATASR